MKKTNYFIVSSLIITLTLASCSSGPAKRSIASLKSSSADCGSLLLRMTNMRAKARAAAISTKKPQVFHENLMDYIDEKTTFEDLLEILKDSPVIQQIDPQGILYKAISYLKEGRHTEQEIEDAFKNHLFSFLVAQGRQAKSQKEFFYLIDKMRYAQLHSHQQYEVILSSPYLQNVLAKNNDLKLKEAFHPNVEFDNSHLLRHIESVLAVLMEQEPMIAAKSVSNSFSFLKMVERINEQHLNVNRDVLTALSQSTFCQEMGISVPKISQIVSRVELLGEGKVTSAQVEEIIKDEIAVYKLGKKRLSDISRFDGEVNMLQVKNQCYWGSCWVFSASSKLETEISANLGKKVAISPEYFYARYIIDQVGELIQNGVESPKEDLFQEGGSFYLHRLWSNFYGAVPTSAWKPKLDFGQKEQKDALLKELRYLADSYFVSRKMPNVQDPANQVALKVAFQSKIRPIVEKYSGQLPDDFEFNGERLAPQQFLEKYYPDFNKLVTVYSPSDIVGRAEITQASRMVEVIRGGGWSKKFMDVKAQNVTMEEIERRIMKNIDAGKPVVLSFLVPSEASYMMGTQPVPFMNKLTGLMTAPPYSGAPIPTRGGHAVVAIGYELDSWGRFRTIKILNSWGEGAGDSGIYYMDRSFFSLITRITVNE